MKRWQIVFLAMVALVLIGLAQSQQFTTLINGLLL